MFNYDYAHRLLGLLHTLHTHKTIKIWNTKDGRCLRTFQDVNGITALIYTESDYLASGSRDNLIKIWDIPNAKLKATLLGHKKEVSALIYLENGNLVSASDDKTGKWKIFTIFFY